MREIIKTIKESTDTAFPKTDGFFKTCPVPWQNLKCAQIKKKKEKDWKVKLKIIKLHNSMEYKRIRVFTKKIFVEKKRISWNFHKKVYHYKEGY